MSLKSLHNILIDILISAIVAIIFLIDQIIVAKTHDTTGVTTAYMLAIYIVPPFAFLITLSILTILRILKYIISKLLKSKNKKVKLD